MIQLSRSTENQFFFIFQLQLFLIYHSSHSISFLRSTFPDHLVGWSENFVLWRKSLKTLCFLRGYKDLDNDLVRINSDESCRRAFDIAQANNWNTLRILIECKAEKKLNQQILELQKRETRLHKKLQKWKKTQGTSGMKMKKGSILLDRIWNNKKKDEMFGSH